MSDEKPETERIYPIRISVPAAADLDEAHERFEELIGTEHADEWKNGLFGAIRTLAVMPRKHNIAEESQKFGYEVRELSYQLRRGVIYRVLFQIVLAEDEPPFVRILHIRHAARKSMTKAEAQERTKVIAEES